MVIWMIDRMRMDGPASRVSQNLMDPVSSFSCPRTLTSMIQPLIIVGSVNRGIVRSVTNVLRSLFQRMLSSSTVMVNRVGVAFADTGQWVTAASRLSYPLMHNLLGKTLPLTRAGNVCPVTSKTVVDVPPSTFLKMLKPFDCSPLWCGNANGDIGRFVTDVKQ